MEIIVLPPQKEPKHLTAYARAKSLGEHMRAFMSQHISSDEEEIEDDEEDEISVNTAEGILKIIVDLHQQSSITWHDVRKVQRRISDNFKVGSTRANRIVARSFGFQTKAELRRMCIRHEKNKTVMVLDRSKTMDVYQALFYSMVKSGVINSPSDVTLPELIKYATPEFISIVKDYVRSEDPASPVDRLTEIEEQILNNPDVELSLEDRGFAITRAIHHTGEKQSGRLASFKAYTERKGVLTPTAFHFNWLFISVREKFILKKFTAKKKAYDIRMQEQRVCSDSHHLKIKVRLDQFAKWLQDHPCPELDKPQI